MRYFGSQQHSQGYPRMEQETFHQADVTPFAGGAKNTILDDLIGYTGMSKLMRKLCISLTFFEKYSDDLGDVTPKTEQVI